MTRAQVALFVASVAGLAVAAVLVACPPSQPTLDPAPACDAVIKCYFTANPDVDHAALVQAIPEFSDAQLFIETYGVHGSCWTGGRELAHSCEDRCRGLLSQDCVRPFSAVDGGPPVCPQACAFPEACSTTASNGAVTLPVCPATKQTQLVQGKPQPVAEPCTAPAPGQGQISFGCCLGPGARPTDACQYTYADATDCRGQDVIADVAVCTADGGIVLLGDAGPAGGGGEGEGEGAGEGEGEGEGAQ